MKRKLAAADLFCGAGGTTAGAVASGFVDMRLAVNHWRTAIFSHRENHPQVRHICARIDDIDPRNDKTLPKIDLLMASPECTHHSNARGGRPIDDQKRATSWHVIIWAEAMRPKWVVVENVREFRNWGPLTKEGRPNKRRKGQTFRAWLKSLESLGYQVSIELLNAADFGAATKRIRLFVVARLGSSRRDIPWPEITHPQADWKPAWSILDFSKPCPSIFSRKKPLAEKTLRRIEIGLRKFIGEAAEPFLVNYHGGVDPRRDGTERQCDPSRPLPTIDTSNRYGLVAPFVIQAQGPGGSDDSYKGVHDPREPMRTLLARNNLGVIVPFFLPRTGIYDSKKDPKPSKSLEVPLNTILASVAPGHVITPFLTKYYGTGVVDPLDTVTAKGRFGLALVETMKELGVVDIGFRMLDVDELARAQGFPENYYLHGTKAEQVRQVGNAVCPPVAEAICRTIGDAA